MSTGTQLRNGWSVLFVLATLSGASLMTYVLWRADHGVVRENHLIEWSQAALLLLAALAHALRGRRTADPTNRVVRWSMGLLCLSMALREIDVDELVDAELMSTLELILRSSLVVGWIVFAWWARPSLKPLWAQRRDVVTSGSVLVFGAGCLFYLASWPFDKNRFDLEGGLHVLIEETLQLNAAILLLAGAFFALPWERSTAAEPAAAEKR